MIGMWEEYYGARLSNVWEKEDPIDRHPAADSFFLLERKDGGSITVIRKTMNGDKIRRLLVR